MFQIGHKSWLPLVFWLSPGWNSNLFPAFCSEEPAVKGRTFNFLRDLETEWKGVRKKSFHLYSSERREADGPG